MVNIILMLLKKINVEAEDQSFQKKKFKKVKIMSDSESEENDDDQEKSSPAVCIDLIYTIVKENIYLKIILVKKCLENFKV